MAIQKATRKTTKKAPSKASTTKKKTATAKKPAIKTASVKSKSTTKKPVVKTATKQTKPRKTANKQMKMMTLTPEDRHHLISVKAYQLSESQGFAPGMEEQNWLEAEKMINERYM